MKKTSKTSSPVASVCIYGTSWTGSGYIADTKGGQMFGDGEPKAGRSAAKHNPELAQEYVKVEATIGHKFTAKYTIAEVVAEAQTAQITKVEDWDA